MKAPYLKAPYYAKWKPLWLLMALGGVLGAEWKARGWREVRAYDAYMKRLYSTRR